MHSDLRCFLMVATLLALTGCRSDSRSPEQVTASDSIEVAVAKIRELGGRVVRREGHVTDVDLTSNSKVSDATLAHLKELTELEILELGGTSISDVGLVYLKGLTNLISLDISRTKVTDAGMEFLFGLTKLSD